MKVPNAAGRRVVGPNLTPLIDVIFLLIIFFLAASHFARTDPAEPVDLPAATRRDVGDEPPRRLTVTIAPGPRFTVAGREQSRAEVEAAISTAATERSADDPLELRLRADKSVPFGEVEPLLVAAAKAGLRDVKFAVLGK